MKSSLLSKYKSTTNSPFYCNGVLIEGDLFTVTTTTVNPRIESVTQIYFQTPAINIVSGGKVLKDIASSVSYIIAESNVETFAGNAIYKKYRIYPVNSKIRLKIIETVISKVTGKPMSTNSNLWSDYYACHIYGKDQVTTPSGVKQTFKVITPDIPDLKDTSFIEIDVLGSRQITNLFKQNGVFHFEV